MREETYEKKSRIENLLLFRNRLKSLIAFEIFKKNLIQLYEIYDSNISLTENVLKRKEG